MQLPAGKRIGSIIDMTGDEPSSSHTIAKVCTTTPNIDRGDLGVTNAEAENFVEVIDLTLDTDSD